MSTLAAVVAAFDFGKPGAVIPARWTADLIEGVPEGVTRIYSDGMTSRADAVADLVAQLKRFGLSGSLRLIAA